MFEIYCLIADRHFGTGGTPPAQCLFMRSSRGIR
jgi:hypothetical protein